MGLHATVDVRGVGADVVFPQIEEVLRELGVEAEAEAPAREDDREGELVGAVEGDIELPLVVSVSVLLVPFFHSLVSKAGEDAYAALKKLVTRAVTVEEDKMPDVAVEARPAGIGKVAFHDAQTRVEFTLDLHLPDVAFRRLTEIDWPEVVEMRPTWQRSIKLRWDPNDEEWWIALFNRPAPLAGAVLEVGEQNFQAQVIEADRPVLVHFWAPRPAPGAEFASTLAELAYERDDLRIAKLNVEANPDLVELYGIGVTSAPTLLLFNQGRVAHSIIGARPKSELVREIESALAGAAFEVGEWNFQAEVIEADGPVLVHFWAPWASPCAVIAPVLTEVAGERDDLRIAKLNIDENPDLVSGYGILSVPTLLLFKHGEPVHAIIGARPKSNLVREIESALEA